MRRTGFAVLFLSTLGVAATLGVVISGITQPVAAQSPAPPQSQMTKPQPHSMPGHSIAGNDGSAANAAPKLAEQQFKNIQVLKSIPADQLIPSMQFIAASLGVECEYCHVERAFEKDDKKPKQTARKMISMMMAINKENFDGHREVTCNTCHRGSANPISIPSVAANDEVAARPRPENGNAQQPTALPAALDLLDKYLAAVGGADALHKITTRVEKGNLVAGFPGMSDPLPIELYAKAPDKRISVMHTPGGDSVTAFNGVQGWLSIGGRTHLMTALENEAARMNADLYLPQDVQSIYAQYVTRLGEQIDGHETWMVVGMGDPPLHLTSIRKLGCCSAWFAMPITRSVAIPPRLISPTTARSTA